MLRPFLLILLTALLLPAHAEDRSSTLKQLEQARKEISDLQKLLGSLNQEKSGVLKRLQATESEMSTLQKQISDLEQQLRDSEEEIKRLDEEKKKLQGERDSQRELIASQARAAYKGGQQEALKLLLNQEDPAELSRLLTYHEYLARARNEQLENYRAILDQLQTVEAELTDQHALLAGQNFELQEQREELDKKLAEHKSLVARITREMGSKEQRLAQMRREQEALDRTLREFDRRLSREQQLSARSTPATPDPKTTTSAAPSWDSVARLSFSQSRGKMPLPLSGNVLARFGSTREADIKWDGMLIGASSGSTVRAIHGGKVVFASWMKSLGMLLIIDHGGGYMSLYGYNQILLKSVNDRVSPGEAIARVGISGGQSTPSLYFAIRHNGQPVNPQLWCSTQG